MKTAIVYYSMSGNTKETAEKIAQLTGAETVRIEPVKEYPSKGMIKFLWGGKSALMGDTPPLSPYSFDPDVDRIIFGTPVWASSFTPPLRSFISENREALKGKRFALFLCYSGGGAEKAAEKLRSFLQIEGFEAQLILTDPKDRPDPANEARIKAFCDELNG